jgi:hypothetical protein
LAEIEPHDIADIFPIAFRMSADNSSSVGISLKLADVYA